MSPRPLTCEELLAALRATHSGPSVLDEVAAERERQDELWGEQHHPNGTGPLLALEWFPNTFVVGPAAADIEGWAKRRYEAERRQNTGTYEHILTEEWAEVIASDDPAKLRVELIQLAAVAVAWVEKIDRDLKGEAPTEPRLCPECASGKQVNCALVALDPAIDDFVPCATTQGGA